MRGSANDNYKPDLPRDSFTYRIYYQFINTIFSDSDSGDADSD